MRQLNETHQTIDVKLKHVSHLQKEKGETVSINYTKGLLRLSKADLLDRESNLDGSRKYYKLAVRSFEKAIKLSNREYSAVLKSLKKNDKYDKEITPKYSEDQTCLHEIAGLVLFHDVARIYKPGGLNRNQSKKIRKASNHFSDALCANQERGNDRIDLKHLRADTKAMRAGKYYKQSVALYNECLAECDTIDNILPALYSKGLSLYVQRKYEIKKNIEGKVTPTLYQSARECFERVLKFNEVHIHSINGMGNIELAQKNTAVAAEYFQRALGVDPDYAPAHYNLGVCLEHQGSFKPAIRCYDAVEAAYNSSSTKVQKQAASRRSQVSEELTQWQEIGIVEDSASIRNAFHAILDIKVGYFTRKRRIGKTTKQVTELNTNYAGNAMGTKTHTEITNPIGHEIKKIKTIRGMVKLLASYGWDDAERNLGMGYIKFFVNDHGINKRHPFYVPFLNLLANTQDGYVSYIIGTKSRSLPVIHINSFDYLNVRSRPIHTASQSLVIPFDAQIDSEDSFDSDHSDVSTSSKETLGESDETGITISAISSSEKSSFLGGKVGFFSMRDRHIAATERGRAEHTQVRSGQLSENIEDDIPRPDESSIFNKAEDSSILLFGGGN